MNLIIHELTNHKTAEKQGNRTPFCYNPREHFPNTSPSAKTRDYVDSPREYKEHQSKIQQAKTTAIKHDTNCT